MTTAVAPAPIAARALEPERYAIGRSLPRFAARPAHRDELIEMVRACAHDGLGIVPWGGGVSLPREPAIERYDLALDVTGIDRLVEYEPGDLTLTVECGMTIAALRAQLAERGQELPLEAANAARATVGGVLAANASGPRRRHLGGPRDRILGGRFVLGDGTLARTGGKVVKNVAGYGIHRMLVGSRGGLAILVDASFKLLPSPASRLAMIYAADRAWLERPEWSAIARWEPTACTVVSGALAREAELPGANAGVPFWTVLGFEDDPPRVAELRRATAGHLGEPANELRDGEAEVLWQRLSDLEEVRLARLTFAGAGNAPAAALAAGRGPESPDVVLHSACGRLHAFPRPKQGAGLVASFEAAGFELIGSRGCEAAPDVRPAGATEKLRSRIRVALDPAGRFPLGGNWQQGTG